MAKLWLLVFALLSLAGCYEPGVYVEQDDPDMAIRQSRNPPVRPYDHNGIPQVVATTPREGLWSGYNQLGYQAKYGPDQRGTQTILKLDEWGPPEIWTISLYVKEDFDPTTFDGLNIRAQINFGAGGSTQSYECDWLNGTQVSLPMNAVNVIAHFDNVDAGEGAGLAVGVQLARGSRGGTEPPRLTLQEEGALAALGTDTFVVPEFAKKIVLVPATNNAASLTAFYAATTQLNITSGTGASNFVTATAAGNKAVGSRIEVPVSGSARIINVRNQDAAAVIFYSLYAELDG